MKKRMVVLALTALAGIREVKRLLTEERAPTAVEYAIMLALVALAIALGVPDFRAAVVGIFDRTSQVLGLV